MTSARRELVGRGVELRFVPDLWPLRDAVAEINRYSDVKLVLSDPGMGDLALSGSFKLGDGRAVSEALPYALPVKAREQSGEIVISRR